MIAPLKIRSHWELLITNSVRTQTLTIDLQENKFLFRFFFLQINLPRSSPEKHSLHHHHHHHHHRLYCLGRDIMYPTREQLDVYLNHPFFSNEYTESSKKYAFYRGKLDVTVYTLRFNYLPTFNDDVLFRMVPAKLMDMYPNQPRLLGSFQFDLLLCNHEANPPTFYIWRSNSNQRNFDEAHEILFSLNYANTHRFVQTVVQNNFNDLNTNFINSKVTIERPLSVVLSFLPV